MLQDNNQSDLVDLINLIRTVKNNDRVFNEANTIINIIIPILQALHWNVNSYIELESQYTIDKNKVDFALKLDGNVKVLIEVKGMTENLFNWEDQIRKYAVDRNIYLFVLSNGIRWQFYTWLKKGIGFHHFYNLDISSDDVNYVAVELNKLLSQKCIRENLSMNYINYIVSNSSKYSLYAAIEEVWFDMLEEPSPLLCDLIIKAVNRNFEISPDSKHVVKIVSDYNKELIKIRGKLRINEGLSKSAHAIINYIKRTDKIRDVILRLKKKNNSNIVPIREIMPYVFRQIKSTQEVDKIIEALCNIGFCRLIGRKVEVIDERISIYNKQNKI